MGAEGFQNALGYGVGTLAALESLRSPGGLGRFVTGQIAARENPNVRASLTGSPFSSGFLGVSGGRAPLSLGPGGTGPSAPNQVWQPNLPPLAPGADTQQQLAQMTGEVLPTLTLDQRRQAGLAELGIHPSIADQISQLPPGWKPVRIGPQGVSLAPTGDVGGAAEPIQGAPGFVRDPITGRPLRLPTAGPSVEGLGGISAGQARMYDPKILSAIAAGKLKVSGVSPEDAKAILAQQSSTKTDAAVERATRLQELKDESVTNATKTMIEAAPEMKNFVQTVRKDLEDLGPDALSARYEDFMTGRVGFPNRAWAKYAYDVSLIPTKLAQMHGQRGKYIVAEFRKGLETGKQSAPNMLGALDSIEDYSDRLIARRGPQGQITPGAIMGGPGSAAPSGGAGVINLGDGFSATPVP